MKYKNINILNLFVKNLQLFMDKKEMSQTELALKMGQTPGAINRYITGKVEPKISALARIAEEVGIEPYELLLPEIPKETPTVSSLIKKIEEQAMALDGNEELLESWNKLDEDQKEVFMDQIKMLSSAKEKSKKSKA